MSISLDPDQARQFVSPDPANSLDPDQAQQFVSPDLGPNCLPSLSVDETGRQRVNLLVNKEAIFKAAGIGIPIVSEII